jgi:hypothetical protein
MRPENKAELSSPSHAFIARSSGAVSIQEVRDECNEENVTELRLLSVLQSDHAATRKAAFRVTLFEISQVHFEIQQ